MLTLLIKIKRVRGFSLEVTLECVGPVSENVKREKVLEDERIYRKFLSWSRLQKRGMKLKSGLSFDH